MRELTSDVIFEIASGPGTIECVDVLWEGQIKKRLILLNSVLQEARLHFPDDYAKAHLESAWQNLIAMQESDPEIVSDLLLYPTTGAWAAYSLKRMRTPSDVDMAPLWPELSYLSWIAGAAAVRARKSTTIPIAIYRGQVMLPTIGLARLHNSDALSDATLNVNDEAVEIHARNGSLSLAIHPESSSEAWEPVTRLTADHGHPIEVVLDGLDPFRNGEPTTEAVRLSVEEVEHWKFCFDRGWSQLLRDHFSYAGPIQASLRTIIPLSAAPIPAGTSYTSSESFGAVLANAPSGPGQLTLTLIHECQHTKLHALTDCVELTKPSTRKHLYAPWRDDPRPATGLLQGVYAHLGVTEFWRVNRHADSGRAGFSATEFALWRRQVARGISELRASALLTPTGEKFVEVMEKSLTPWLEEDVPAHADLLATERSAGHRVSWCVRNLAPENEGLTRLFEQWAAGLPRTVDYPENQIRLEATQSRFISRVPHPSHMKASKSSTAGESAEDPTLAADRAYAKGDFTSALQAYASKIAVSPRDPESWERYVLAAQRVYSRERLYPLLDRADVVAALYSLAQNSDRPTSDPLPLIDWLGSR